MFRSIIPHHHRNPQCIISRLYSTKAPVWALISDLHFHQPYLPSLSHTTQWLQHEIANASPSQIICLGDLINTRENVSVQALSSTIRFIDSLRHIAPVHVILGNHDMNLKHSHKISSLDVLDMMEASEMTHGRHPVRLYRGMQMVELDGYPVLMSAYHENMTEELKQFVEAHLRQDESPKLSEITMFAHMAVPGAVMSFMRDQNGTAFSRQYDDETSRSRNDSHSSNPVFSRDLSRHRVLSADEEAREEEQQERLDNNIPTQEPNSEPNSDPAFTQSRKRVPKYLSSFRRVFSGHFHHHHHVTPTVTYCGAPMQHHFGDSGDSQRGMILFHPESNKMDFLRNPDWDQFRLIRLNSAEDEDNVLRNISTYKNKHVSIGNTFSTMDLNLERLNQALLQAGARSVRIQPVKLRPSDMAKYAMQNDSLSITAPSLSQSSAAENIHTFHDVLQSYALENDLSEQIVQKGRGIIDKTLNTSAALESLHIGETFRGNLESIIIENFLSIQGEVTFPIAHMKSGVWYIQGDNGSGKSAIFEAVCWALFDRFLRSDMKVDYAVNDKVQRNCRVRLRFSNGYEIERFRKYKTLGGNGVRVYKDGVYLEDMERGHIRDSQRQVENLIGIDYETFTKSIILSDQAVVFLAQDARRRRDFIEQLLGMNVFDTFLETLKEQKREIEQHKTTIEAKISMLTQQVQEIDSQMAEEVNTQQLRQELSEAKKLLDAHTAEIEQFNSEEKQLIQENLSIMKQEWEEYQSYGQRIQYVALQQENSEAMREVQRLEGEIVQLQSTIAEQDKEVYLVESKIQNYRKVLDHHLCVTCERSVDDQQARAMHDKISQDLSPKLESLSADLLEARQHLAQLHQDKAHWDSVQLSLSMQLSRIAGAINLESHDAQVIIPSTKPEWNYSDPYEHIQQSELEEMRRKELQLLANQNKIREKLRSLKYLIEENEKRSTEQKHRLEEQIAAYRDELVQVTNERPLIQFWEQAFSPKPRKGFCSMRGYMLNRSVQDLNKILKYYSKMLTVSYDSTSKPDLIISFDAEFQVNEEYGKRSAGQRKRNQLVIFFSLFELVRQRSRFKSNFLMLDEIFDALDHNGQEDVQLCIRMLCNQPGLDRIFVITHSPDALENIADDFIIDVKSTPKGSDYRFEVEEKVIEQV